MNKENGLLIRFFFDLISLKCCVAITASMKIYYGKFYKLSTGLNGETVAFSVPYSRSFVNEST